MLKSGKMSAKVEVVSNNVIGPSLGAEPSRWDSSPSWWRIFLLMVLMVVYYGWIPVWWPMWSDPELYFTFGILASLQRCSRSPVSPVSCSRSVWPSTPMCSFFERTKEELKNGKKLRQAISEGYSNAFSAIFDSNLTSVITGVILLLFAPADQRFCHDAHHRYCLLLLYGCVPDPYRV